MWDTSVPATPNHYASTAPLRGCGPNSPQLSPAFHPPLQAACPSLHSTPLQSSITSHPLASVAVTEETQTKARGFLWAGHPLTRPNRRGKDRQPQGNMAQWHSRCFKRVSHPSHKTICPCPRNPFWHRQPSATVAKGVALESRHCGQTLYPQQTQGPSLLSAPPLPMLKDLQPPARGDWSWSLKLLGRSADSSAIYNQEVGFQFFFIREPETRGNKMISFSSGFVLVLAVRIPWPWSRVPGALVPVLLTPASC